MSNSGRKFRRAYFRRTGKVWKPTQSVTEKQQITIEHNEAEITRILARSSRPPFWRRWWVWIAGTFRLHAPAFRLFFRERVIGFLVR